MSNQSDDFASAALYDLIVAQCARQGFDVSTEKQFSGKIDSGIKANLLAMALDKLGPHGVLSIGQGIKGVQFQPVLAVLLRSTEPEDLLQRWQRLETYYHGRHRVRVASVTCNSTLLEHYSTDGTPPTAGEDLVIAGLIAAMLQEIGIESLNLTINGTTVIRDSIVQTHLPSLSHTQHWQFTWHDSTPQTQKQTLALAQTGDVDGAPDTVIEQITDMLRDDMGRGWDIETVARAFALSKRSLQRRLHEAGTQFQIVLRSARADCAASLLLKDTQSLSEVGYSSGYAEAHFSREFKLRFNLSPAQFRELAMS